METWVLILALVGGEGSSQSIIEFSNKEDCNSAMTEIVPTMKSVGAPGYFEGHGVYVKAFCLKAKKGG